MGTVNLDEAVCISYSLEEGKLRIQICVTLPDREKNRIKHNITPLVSQIRKFICGGPFIAVAENRD